MCMHLYVLSCVCALFCYVHIHVCVGMGLCVCMGVYIFACVFVRYDYMYVHMFVHGCVMRNVKGRRCLDKLLHPEKQGPLRTRL